METAKDFYRNYQADDNWSRLSDKLLSCLMGYEPAHVLEFGSGSGKHIRTLEEKGIVGCGLDISMNNLLVSKFKNLNEFLILGDDKHLRHLCNFDAVCTCSVLDHIEYIDGIIGEFKRIANKVILLAETNDVPAPFYYPHDYESLGFEKLDFEWQGEDGATYHIWRFIK